MRRHLPLLIRAAVIAAALGSLLLPAAGWKESMSGLELAAEAALALMAFAWTPRAHWSWKAAMTALFAGDLLFNVQFRLNITAAWLYPAEGVLFILYAVALAAFLLRPYRSGERPAPGEKRFLALIAAASLYISFRYVLLPYFHSGNNAGLLNYSLATAFRAVQAATIALAFALSLRARSVRWLCLTQGVLLLSVASVALGYNEGVLLGQNPTFHEYGWLWGLLLLALSQTWPDEESGPWSRWDGIRVRMAWVTFLFNVALLWLLFVLDILQVRDAYRATSLLYVVYALWSVSNLIALRVSVNIERLLDSIGGRGARPAGAPGPLHIHEIGLFAERLREAYARIELQSAMAAIGQTAAMLAHDVRKPFALTKALISSLSSAKDDPEELARSRASIERAIAHADAMISDVMDFSRAVRLELRPESLPALLDFSLRQAAGSRPGAAVRLEYALRHTRKPLADAGRLARVFSNVLGNAAEAITVIGGRDSGTVRVSSADVRADGGNFVEVAFANDGPPVAELDLPRLFESFFTKGKTAGTGLGLASAKKTVELHGGSISARNLPGGAGVEFLVRLPASAEPDAPPERPLPELLSSAAAGPAPEAPPAARRSPGGRLVVLACDDDELARRCVALELKRVQAEGLETGVFPGARPLLDFLRSDAGARPATRYLIFTDQNMPGMSGLELAAAVRDLRLPDCRVYLVSNEPVSELGPRAAAAGAAGCLEAPLDAAAVTPLLG